MFEPDVAALDADATLSAASGARAVADWAETRLLQVAAHWADLNGELDRLADGRRLPGMERLVRLGGEGTPEVSEFAPAELGAQLAMSPYAAARLVGDAVDLRHRLPRLWARVLAGEVRPWIARRAAESTRDLTLAIAAVVDRRVTPWAHSISWGRLEAIIGVVIAADPEAAALAAEQAEIRQGVWLGRSTDAGIKDIFIRTEAANAIWFDASIDRIADGLGLFGDTSSKDVRRGRAVGVLAQPQRALDLFAEVSITSRSDDGCRDAASVSADGGALPQGRLTASSEPATGVCGGSVDSRPPATLYIHVSQDAFTRDAHGVARFEGLGPITLEQARRWLGHCSVTIKPVIDLNDEAPVDAYEVPDRLREAVHLRSPVDVFPFATSPSRRRDIDHTDPYRSPDDGGPPGQTRLDNLGPMVRFHHRIKTHSRWRVRQVFNGVFVWRSPHGRVYVVDATGASCAFSAA